MSERKSPVEHDVHDLIARRWSPHAFSDRGVEPERLASLFEAARWAPSCYNEQPWRFLVAAKHDRAEYEKLLGCLVDANRAWAQNAPVLVLSVASLRFARNGKPNRHAMHDTGLAVENLVIQACAMGLVVHQMAGFDVDAARTRFEIGDAYEPAAMIAIGYPGDAASLDPHLRERESAPRSRNPFDAFVFRGTLGNPASLKS